MSQTRGKILIIRGGAIGDFILTVPAIKAVRTNFPDAHLDLLGYTAVAQLARTAGIIDDYRSIEARALARFFARNAELDPEWSAYFASFSLIISYLYDPDEIFKTNVTRVSKAQFIEGRHRPSENEDLHATSVFLQPLERLAIFDADPLPSIVIPNSPPLPPGNWLAVHPGSGSPSKNWPEENWFKLLQELSGKSSLKILLVGGEAEGDKIARLSAALPADRTYSLQSKPLSEVASFLAKCKAFVGHDSGISHLAAALGLQSVLLWGPSRERIWRPPHPHVWILRSENGIDSLPLNLVKQATLEKLERL